MFVGIPNPNILIPVEKMRITDLDHRETFEVLYNPQNYSRRKSVNYRRISRMTADAFDKSLQSKALYPLCGVVRKSKPRGRPKKDPTS